MLMKLTTAISYVRILCSFHVLTFCVSIYLAKDNWQEVAPKMLVKMTSGVKFINNLGEAFLYRK